MRSLLLAFSVLSVSLIGVSASAVTVALGASKDNTLYEDATGSWSNGAGEYMFAGKTAITGGSKLRRAVIAFNVSSIPAGASVTSVQLKLNMSKTISGAQTVTLHRLTADWGEGTSNASAEEGAGAPSTTGDATWIHRSFNTTSWSTAGGDYSATASGSVSVNAEGFYTWGSTAQMVADVQGWVTNGATNFGWVLIGNEATASTAKRFDTKEALLTQNRPELTVQYSTSAEATDWMLFY